MESLTNDLVGAVLGEEARASWRCVRERRLPIRHEVDAAVAYVPVFRDILREQLELQEPAAVARLEARYRQTLIDSRADRVVPAAAAVRRITVETLGPDRDIRVDGRSCNIKRFKVIEFAALLSGSGRRLHRSAAQWALFPDADAARASNYFRQVLFQFRTHTGIEFRPNDRGYLELPDDVAIETTDQRLERALGHAARERDAVAFNALDEALGHAGAYLIDSDLEWAELRRFELDTIVEQARLIAARLALDLGRPDAAMRLARAALEADPDCEGAWEVLVGLGGAASAPDAHAAIAKRLRRVRDAFGATHAE
jgi:two-component SAPR family response regulator